jgi:hypothetical protein
MMTQSGTVRTPAVKTCGQSALTGSYAVATHGVIKNLTSLFRRTITKKIRIFDELF